MRVAWDQLLPVGWGDGAWMAGGPRTSSCCFRLKASARSASFSRCSFSRCSFSRWASSRACESSLSNL